MPICRFAKTSTAFLKGKACSTGFLDKTIWNPRPVIDLLSRAVFESGVSFLHFLGPTLVRFWRFSALLTGAVGTLEGTEIKPGKHSNTRIKSKAVAFDQRPRPLPLQNLYTRTGTYVR